jgi:monoamine oxidase
MMAVDRRTFLQSAAALPAALTLGRQVRPRVIVVGAGLAGLAAAYELDAAGHDVTVLEARTRPGGRVYTMREPFSDGLYAEAGAARIQDTHAFTLRYAKQFDLALDPFWPNEGTSITQVAGRRISGPPRFLVNLADVPLPFSDEERKLGHGPSLVKYLFSHLPALGDVTEAHWTARDLSRFEQPIAEFCRLQGASPALLKLLALGHDLGGMSTLHLLRDSAVGAATRDWYSIRGGNDLLPRALAARLAERISYGTPVVRIEQDPASVRVTCLRAETPLTITGDYAVCAIPLPVLRRVEIAPELPPLKRAAVDEVEFMPMARVFLQSRQRFWLARGESGWANTDDPMDVWDYTRGQPGTRGILGAYTSGRMARQISARDPAARGAFVLEMMERVHPGIRQHYEGSASYSWVTDPWALGAAAEFKAGQLSRFYAAMRTPEGRIHFAGEHTSPWSGWMNGGLESGNRAAAEILARRQ